MNIYSIFYYIIQTSVYGSIVGIIIYILNSTLLRKLSAKWHYLLWYVMILKLVFPKGPESKISIFNQLKYSAKITETELFEYAKRVEPITEITNLESSVSLGDILSYIWLTGFIIALLWVCISFIMLEKSINTSSSEPKNITREILMECVKKTNTHGKIRLIVQNHITATSLYGFFKPKILITKDFENMNKKHIQNTFIHELSHCKRGDIVVNYLLLFLRCAHWFNPIIWFLFKKIRRDTELATDELAMSFLFPDEHKDYGLTLIDSLSLQKKKSSNVLGMASSKSDIKKRVKSIAEFKKTSFFKHICSFFTLLLVASISLTSSVVAKPVADKIIKSIPIAKPENTINKDVKPIEEKPSEEKVDKKTEILINKTTEEQKTEMINFSSSSPDDIVVSNELDVSTVEKDIKTDTELKYTAKSSIGEINTKTDNSQKQTEHKDIKNPDVVTDETQNDIKIHNVVTNDTQNDIKIPDVVTNEPPNDAVQSKAEYIHFENMSIDTVIKNTNQVIDNSKAVTDLNQNAKIIEYNTDCNDTYKFKVIPNDEGYIQLFVENEGFNHDVYIGVYHVESNERGWDYCFNTQTKTPIYLDGYENGEEYVVTLNCYCPGHYNINGRILVY